MCVQWSATVSCFFQGWRQIPTLPPALGSPCDENSPYKHTRLQNAGRETVRPERHFARTAHQLVMDDRRFHRTEILVVMKKPDTTDFSKICVEASSQEKWPHTVPNLRDLPLLAFQFKCHGGLFLFCSKHVSPARHTALSNGEEQSSWQATKVPQVWTKLLGSTDAFLEELVWWDFRVCVWHAYVWHCSTLWTKDMHVCSF